MKKLLLTVALILSFLCSSAQNLPVIVPPSPEATSLAKFTEIPISHYTGLPNINVPIHTINFEGLKIPIALSYHARGIRVEEIASRVGIGWALNAGGMITRQTRGKDDFHPNEGYIKHNFYDGFHDKDKEYIRNYVYTRDVSGKIDLVPDQFSFNFLGYSGKFIFDQNTKRPILQSYDDLTFDEFSGNQFIITNSDGFKFYFGSPNLSNQNRNARSKDTPLENYVFSRKLSKLSNEKHSPINTWHLIDIISPTGKKIHFNYVKENTVFFRRSYDKIGSNGPSSYFSKYQGEQYQIKTIIYDDEKVEFIKSSDPREDLLGGHVLSSIEIKNKNFLVKKFNLNYSYSNDKSGENVNTMLINMFDPYARKRLFLDSIVLISNDGRNSTQYRAFKYNNKNSLPNRFSNSQDIWGYFNGAQNGSFLTFFKYALNNNINRRVDTIKNKIGLIEKVIYPTGGYSSYTFEANKAKVPDYFKNLLFLDPNPAPLTSTEVVSIIKTPEIWTSRGTYEKTFTIDDSATGMMTISVSFYGDDVGNCSSNENNERRCKYQVSIVGVNGTSFTSADIFQGTSNNFKMPPPGNYKIVVNPRRSDSPNDLQNGFTISLTWQKILNSSTDNNSVIHSGGNRIRKIENNSLDKGKIIKTYEYLNRTGESSGLVFSLPSYYFIKKSFTSNGRIVNVIDPIGARPGSPLSYEQGNHVGYSRVIEYISSDSKLGKGGKTEFEFTAMPDDGDFYKPPYTIPIDNEWLRGKPMLISYYKRDSTAFSLIKKEKFTYQYAQEPFHMAITNPKMYIQNPENPIPEYYYTVNRLKFNIPLIVFKLNEVNGAHTNQNSYKIYNVNGGASNLLTKTETNYSVSGELKEETTYFYDYNKHYQLKGSEVKDSKGDVYKTTHYYPTDKNQILTPFPLTTGAKQASDKLLKENRFEVLQTKTHKNGKILSTVRNNYKNFNSDIISLKNIQASKAKLPLESRIIYHDYDDKGKPLEVSKKDGTHLVYIWGYNQTYPIAKIENAMYNEIKIYVKALQNLSNKDDDRQIGYSGNEGKLRKALDDNLRNNDAYKNKWKVTSYTYDPLIGVTSITDPRGETIYYHYDNFNRLEFVKDKDGNILKEHKYNNYKK